MLVTLIKQPLTLKSLLSDSSVLPSNLSVAQNIFKTYKNSIKNRKYEEATKIKTEVTDLIENNFDTIAGDMRWFGIKLREDKLFLESILIFDIVSTLSKKIENPENKLEVIGFCVAEMKNTNKAMIGEDRGMKVVVKDYVIPLMRYKLHYIESTSSVSEQYKCLQVSWVLHYIEVSQGRVDHLKEREQTLREGLKRMHEVFGENKIKHKVYGTLLNNLGFVCGITSRYEEAASFYKQSIDAEKAATDYDGDEEERKRFIELSENNLRIVQQKIKCLVM